MFDRCPSAAGRPTLSALAVAVHRHGGEAAAGDLEPLLDAMGHHGAGERRVAAVPGGLVGVIGAGHASTGSGAVVAFTGRVDNRDDLSRSLGGPRGLGDAGLVDAAWRRWGEDGFGRVVGPFAAIVVDAQTRRLLLARDALGDRALVYTVTPELFLAATEERALLAHPAVADDIDAGSVAAFCAVDAPAPGRTFFAAIRELPPAHVVAVSGPEVQLRRYWDLDPPPLRYRRDDEYAEHLRELLREAVCCRLQDGSRTAVLMSGGMDSTSVTALAAGAGASPLAVSWVFDTMPEADERRWIDAVTAHPGVEAVAIRGDDLWTLRPGEEWAANPDLPFDTPYRALYRRGWAEARDRGARVVLTGDFGDQLFWGAEYWLADLVRSGRWARAAADAALHLWWYGLRRVPPRVSARAAAARAVRWRRHRAPARPWLTDEALAMAPLPPPPADPDARERAERVRLAHDPWGAVAVRAEASRAAAAGIDVRRPFHDRRLAEFIAAVPARLLHRPGSAKHLLRQAMRGVLPDRVLQRRHQSSLLPLMRRGLAVRERRRVDDLLAADDAVWPRFVRRDWLAKEFPVRLERLADGPEVVVPWHCLCLELWRRRKARFEIVTNTTRSVDWNGEEIG